MRKKVWRVIRANEVPEYRKIEHSLNFQISSFDVTKLFFNPKPPKVHTSPDFFWQPVEQRQLNHQQT